MSDKALRIVVCDIGPGGDQCAPGFRSTTATLLNKEGAFNSNGWKSISCTTRRKKRWRLGGASSKKAARTRFTASMGRAACCAERLRLMQHLANCLYNLRDGVFGVSLRRSAAWLGLVSILGSES